MRSAIVHLTRILLGVILLCASLASAPAQYASRFDERRAVPREWAKVEFREGEEVAVSDVALLPQHLVLAIERSNCQYRDNLESNLPVRFVSVAKRRFAIVTCGTIIKRNEVFDLSDLSLPRLVSFPVLSTPDGFGATSQPGMIVWKKDAGLFEAATTSDVQPWPVGRHVYRLGPAYEGASFVLVRVELSDDHDWTKWHTIWEASPWSLPTSSSAR